MTNPITGEPETDEQRENRLRQAEMVTNPTGTAALEQQKRDKAVEEFENKK